MPDLYVPRIRKMRPGSFLGSYSEPTGTLTLPDCFNVSYV